MKSGWRKVTFDEAVEDASGGNVKTPLGEYLDDGSLPIVDQGERLIGGYSNEPASACRSPLPVIVFGDHTRRLKYVDFSFGVGADGVKVLRAREGVDTKYLYHYLRSISIPAAGYDRHFKYLKRVSVAFPWLTEQLRIAEVLDRAETLRAQRREALAQLDALAEAIFLDMFGDPVSNPMDWPRKSMGAIGRVVTGNTPSRANAAYFGDAVEWIKSDNLNTPHDHATRATEYLSAAGRTVARVAPAGSILVTCIAGSPDCIGNAAMIEREVAFNQQINALIPSEGQLEFWFSQLTVGKRLVQAASTDGMKGMVSKSRFERIELIAAPEPLQQAFAARRRAVAKMKALVSMALAEADALFASLQHRAFRGEL